MISIVVPAFNEADGIRLLYDRVSAASAAWREPWELVIVDDGSRDDTFSICESVAVDDRRVKAVSLSRNFGHQAAISAGLHYAAGDVIAVMDADLQDPPEELVRFIDKCREGFDVVYAVRTKRKEGPIKRFSYFLYYRLLKRLASLDIPVDAGDFCVMSRRVRDELDALPERNRFLRGLRTWVGFRQTGLAYERSARQFGEPKYTFGKLMKLALDGVINFSYRPLKLITTLAFLTAAVAVLLGCVVFFQYVTDTSILGYNPRQARGWTSLILTLLLLGAMQLFSMGILGEYVGRLFEESKRRPVYIVKRAVNAEEEPGTGVPPKPAAWRAAGA